MNSTPGTSESTAKSPSKRRRNASNVWTYIDKATRKCKVEKCSVKFGEKTSTASLIYHINNEHKIVVNAESLLGCNSEDEFLGSQNQNSQSSNSQKTGSQNDPYRRKHGTVEQTKRDAAILVLIGKKI
jgi:hypothetical protein